ncbi:MAG: DNA-3-methyladenine glycosylase 2 family protein [Myxococcota bacterium]
MAESKAARFALPEHYDLARTVGAIGFGHRDPTTAVQPDAIWRATRTAAGPATLCLRVADGAAEVHAAGPGAAEAIALAPRLLGLADTPEDLVPHTPFIRDLAHRFRGARLTAGLPVSEVILPWILGQRVTYIEAKTSWAELIEAHGEAAPVPSGFPAPPKPLRLLADPAGFGRRDPADLGRFGIDRARAATLLDACRHHRYLDAAAALSPAEAHAKLLALRGIGPWTAGHALAVAMGDPDAVPIGDFHLPNTVGWALNREVRADDARMLELIEPWRGQRWRLLRLLILAGIRAPRFGPRRPPRRR